METGVQFPVAQFLLFFACGRPDDVAATHFEALASEVKTELLKAALETKTIKRLGYVMTAACVATPEECHEVFTHIPPRPARRRKKKPAPQGPAEEGEDGDGDAAAAEGAAAAAEDGGDAAPAELAPEEEDAGDIVRGASLVVWAIRDGRDAAVQIEKYLQLKANKHKSVVAA